MPLSSSNAVRQLHDGNSQGTVLGINASSVIGFYGVTTASKAGISGSSFASLSLSSGALASSLAIALNNLGLIFCSTVAG
jgi:hypothetical protein